MAISLHNIKKWYRMLAGKSILHVNQKIGEEFKKDELRGYYNDLTQKVTMLPDILNTEDLPTLNLEGGNNVFFPVAIFQYGLGAYDLYLKTGDEKYYNKFRQCVDWTVKNQEESGAWNNFLYIYPDNPYGAMAQGEGISLLCRGYKEFGEDEMLMAIRKAISFLILPIDKGGTTLYSDSDVVLLEYTHKPAVLNGWIFALWGLYDYVLLTNDKDIENLLNQTIDTLVKYLPKFDNSYWSMYDLGGKITSPFYHHLHIAQMQALYELTGRSIFNDYAIKWGKRERNIIKKSFSFVIKSWQKIIE